MTHVIRPTRWRSCSGEGALCSGCSLRAMWAEVNPTWAVLRRLCVFCKREATREPSREVEPLAYALRSLGYRPWALVTDADGETLELVSYPFQDDGGVWLVMARAVPGDPTMEVCRIPDEALDLIGEEVA